MRMTPSIKVPVYAHRVHRQKSWTIDLWDQSVIPELQYRRKTDAVFAVNRINADLNAWIWFGLRRPPFVTRESKLPGCTDVRTLFDTHILSLPEEPKKLTDRLNDSALGWSGHIGLKRLLIQRLTFSQLVATQPTMSIHRFRGFTRDPALTENNSLK